jgi:hypothetical protein
MSIFDWLKLQFFKDKGTWIGYETFVEKELRTEFDIIDYNQKKNIVKIRLRKQVK